MPQERLMALLTEHRQRAGPGVLVGVLGGRLSEGIDYPGRDLEAVVVVGTPYPKPTAHQRALLQYYDRRTGHGWDYAVTAPALRRLRQAIGRIRRSADDQGIVILLDERSAPLMRRAGYAVDLVPAEEAVRRLDAWHPDTFKEDPEMGR
jgi:DNA excision repair protein ERCC-2